MWKNLTEKGIEHVVKTKRGNVIYRNGHAICKESGIEIGMTIIIDTIKNIKDQYDNSIPRLEIVREFQKNEYVKLSDVAIFRRLKLLELKKLVTKTKNEAGKTYYGITKNGELMKTDLSRSN